MTAIAELHATAGRTMGLRGVALAGAIVMAVFFGGLGGWAYLAPLDSAAIAPGVVSVDTNRKTVQHLEGGIVREILVRDGDRVSVDQPLMILDRTRAEASLELVLSRRRVAAALAARLEAERDQSDTVRFPDWLVAEVEEGRAQRSILDAQTAIFRARRKALDGQASILEQRIAQVKEEVAGLKGLIVAEDRQLSLIGQEVGDVQSLFDRQLTPKSRLLALQRQQAEIAGSRARNVAAIARAKQSIGEASLQISELTTKRVNEALDELEKTQAELLDLEERIRAARDVLARSVITAPTDGIVVGLEVHTPGAVISSGQPLMDIVPTSDIKVIEARIGPEDIDVVHPDLKAEVRLTATSGRNQRALDGRVRSVSADRLLDDRTGAPYFLARVELEDPDLKAKLAGVDLYPGMPAEVIIVTGERTPLDYLLQPLRTSFRRALREQ